MQSDNTFIILALIVLYFIVKDVIHTITIQKLTNKLMSRNYHDYEFSKNVSKTMEQDKPTLQDALKEERDLREDLSPIDSFYGVN